MEDNLEYRILSLLRKRSVYLQYSPILKDNLFESRETRFIHKLITYYHKHATGRKIAPLNSLYALVSTKAKETEVAKFNQVIRRIKKYQLMDSQIAGVVIKKFAKKQQTKLAIIAAAKSLDSDDEVNVAEIKNRLEEALAIDNVDSFNDAYNYFSNPMQRLEADKNEPRIATMLSKGLDRSINGGLASGEIGIVIAPTKVGKTMLLINLSYNAMRQGKKIVYVTLELSGNRIAARFDQLITNKTYDELTYPMIYRKTKALAAKGAGLMIKDSVSYRMSPNDLALYLERLQKDFPFDMIVVDQLSLMHTPKEYKDRRHELSATCIGLRRVGARFGVPVWAAHQATRIAGERGNTTLWDVSEDIGIANWSDLIIALSQQKEDKEDNVIYLEVVGNRIGPTNERVVLRVDYPKMKLKAIISKAREDEDD